VTIAYVESSALVKLAVREPESERLRETFRRHEQVVTSELAIVEVGRAARRDDDEAGLARARAAMLTVVPVAVDRPILEAAAQLDPPLLRSLDAIHVATAIALESADVVFYSYDRRTIEAAEANGLTVASPGA
jgi:predicted nucleic acid-binding protein